MDQQTVCASGSSSAVRQEPKLEALATEWRLRGYRLALKITGCPEAAEDALQEALLRAFRHAGKLRDPRAAAGWFRRILVRCAMDQAAVPLLQTTAPEQPALHDHIEEALQVRRTLSHIRPDQRALLALAIGEGLSYEEVGQALGVPAGTVASRLHTAKEAFRRAWGGEP